LKIEVNSFGSMALGIAPHLLPPDGAQIAKNVCFDKGDLRAWRKPLSTQTFTSTYDSTVQYLDTDAKRIVHDDRLYYCTSDTPNPSGTFNLSYWTVLDSKSLYRFEENTNEHWIMADTDRDYVRTPIPDDAYERVYFSGENELRAYCNDLVSSPFDPWGDYYKVGIPFPIAAPTLGSYSTGGAVYRAYFYTYVNKYGEEGAPSDVAEVTDYTSGNITLSLFSENPSGRALESGLIRVYRTNASDAGTAAFQFVDEFNISGFNFTTGTYVDSVADADLGEICPSIYWGVPPDGITNVKLFKSNTLVGIADNKLCFSVPGIPHAWTDTSLFRYPIPSKAKGFGIYGSSVYVLTDDFYYVFYGDAPDEMGMSQSGAKYPCASKRSIFETNDGVGFAGHEGLMLLNQSGCINLTETTIYGIIDWIALNPETIYGEYYNGKYFFFYTDGEGIKHGMLLDMTGGNKLTELIVHAYDCFWDYGDGKFYMILTENNLYAANQAVSVKEWNADPYNYLKFYWKGRKELLTNKMLFKVGKCFIDIDYYNSVVTNAEDEGYLSDLNAALFAAGIDQSINNEAINDIEINGDELYAPSSLAIDSTVEVKVYLDNAVVHTEVMRDSDIFIINNSHKGDVLEVEVSGYVPVYRVSFAGSAQELIVT